MKGSTLPPRFRSGRLMATPAARATLQEHGISLLSLVARHVSGDFGHISFADSQANEQAIELGGRILSSYPVVLGSDLRVWVITEADRSSTCVLMPDDY